MQSYHRCAESCRIHLGEASWRCIEWLAEALTLTDLPVVRKCEFKPHIWSFSYFPINSLLWRRLGQHLLQQLY